MPSTCQRHGTTLMDDTTDERPDDLTVRAEDKPTSRVGATLAELTTLNLNLSPTATALRTRGVGQLVIKILYAEQGPIEVGAIQEGLKVFTGVALSSPDLVLEALAFLEREDRWVQQNAEEQWSLQPEARAKVSRELGEHDRRLDEMLRQRFPRSMPLETLRLWFRAVSVEYFGRYGTEAVRAVFRETSPDVPRALLPDLVEQTARAFGLEKSRSELLIGFQRFIEEPTENERLLILSAWQSMFAAKLIMARAGVDPISAGQLGDSDVLLDTNVLFALALSSEGDDRFGLLAKGFKRLGLRARIVGGTEVEYRRALLKKREQVLRVAKGFSAAALEKARDPFILAAVALGCASLEDFERFFDAIAEVPGRFGDQRIQIADDEQTLKDYAAGIGDTELVDLVTAYWAASRPYQKGSDLADHDAGITAVVDGLRERGVKAWVLTADMTMCALANNRSGPEGLPTWVSIYALVEILAASGGDPALSGEEFGGLLAAIFENDLQPLIGTYTLTDMDWLLRIQAQAASLDPDVVERMITTVTRARLQGMGPDDPELNLRVSRMFEREASALSGDRDAALRDRDAAVTMLTATDEQLTEEKALRQGAEAAAGIERRRRQLAEATLDFLKWSFLFVLIGTALVLLGYGLLSSSKPEDLVRVTLGQIAMTAGVVQIPVTVGARALMLWRMRRNI